MSPREVDQPGVCIWPGPERLIGQRKDKYVRLGLTRRVNAALRRQPLPEMINHKNTMSFTELQEGAGAC